jgi:transposase InsO family protein
MRTDGGPQSAAKEFRDFLKKWGVDPALSTPHYPQSNGHAESSVKAKKNLVIKTSGGDTKAESFQQGLLEFRNTPRADGRSPAQVVFGHPMRSMVPAHYRSFASEWQQTPAEADKKGAKLHLQQKENYDKSARPIEPLKVGQEV